MAFGQSLAKHVGYEVQVAWSVDFGDDEGVDVCAAQHGGEVFEGEAGAYAVDSDGLFANGGRAGAVEDGEDVLAAFGLFGRGHGVFEVVGYAVYGEGAGFLEEAH